MGVYQRSSPGVIFNQAHNHYLQVAAEGGLLVGLPVALALAAFVRAARRSLETDRSGVFWMRAGAASGLCGVAVQSMWETGLTTPANAALAAVLAAIVVHVPDALRIPEPLMSLRIGIDIDGVLADFRTAFRKASKSSLGHDIDEQSDPKPSESLGAKDVQRVWEHIAQTPNWWMTLRAVRAGSDRAALQPDAGGGVGSVLSDEPAAERRRHGAVPDAVVDRAARLLPAGGADGAGLARRGRQRAAARSGHRRPHDELRRSRQRVDGEGAPDAAQRRQGGARSTRSSRGIGVVPNLAEALVVIERLHDAAPAPARPPAAARRLVHCRPKKARRCRTIRASSGRCRRSRSRSTLPASSFQLPAPSFRIQLPASSVPASSFRAFPTSRSS